MLAGSGVGYIAGVAPSVAPTIYSLAKEPAVRAALKGKDPSFMSELAYLFNQGPHSPDQKLWKQLTQAATKQKGRIGMGVGAGLGLLHYLTRDR